MWILGLKGLNVRPSDCNFSTLIIIKPFGQAASLIETFRF